MSNEDTHANLVRRIFHEGSSVPNSATVVEEIFASDFVCHGPPGMNQAERPRLAGKRDASGVPLVPAEGELSPGLVAALLRHWLDAAVPGSGARLRPPPPSAVASPR